MDNWSAFLVFDREVDSFSCYDGELVDTGSKSAFKVTPLGKGLKLIKGSLISESFFLELKSSKKGAKSRP